MTLFVTYVINAVVLLVSWILITLERETGLGESLFEPAVLGAGLAIIGITSFFGIYINVEGDASRMRGAIAGAVVTVYFVLLADVLVIEEFAEVLKGDVASDVHKTFGGIVAAVTGYYFASRTVESVNDRIQTRKENVAGRNDGGS